MRESLCGLVALLVLAAPGWSANESQPLSPSAAAVEATPEQDDAALHDVQLLGSRYGWAVGDRGTVWKTADGGRTWQFCRTPVTCSLRGVCFLTDQIGWAVGGDVTPYSREPAGVVLGTTDGGQSWQVLADAGLPLLCSVSFFGPENGVAAGTASAAFPTGVMTTSDGGRTWQPMPGEPSDGWRAAAFLNEATGALAGLRGQFATAGGGSLLPRARNMLGLRGLHALDLQQDGRGWLVGDGALILSTTSGGASWTEPLALPPAALREFFDARGVTSQADRVWIAGAPGSVIWHSADGGASWSAQSSGDPTPLYAIDSASERRACAVGAFGRIVVTDDGGQTWTTARGGGRRAALLAVSASLGRAPLRLCVRIGAEQGYRAVIAVSARRDIGPDGHLEADADLRLHQAVIAAGGGDSEVGWKLPVAAPGLDRDYRRLLEQWTLLTDGRLPDVLLQELVAGLRLWRPDVIVLDEAGEQDAAARLLRQAILHAVAQAADPHRYPLQQELMLLPPWNVQRVYVRLGAGESAGIRLDPHEILQRHQKTLLMASADVLARLGLGNPATAEYYQQVYPTDDGDAATRRELFSGLSLAAGQAARRALPPVTELNYEELEHRAQHQRNFAAWRDRALDDPRYAAQVVAQLSDVVGDAPQDQAALQLAALGEAYRQRGHWQLAEETLTELVQRYPDQPVAVDAMLWLLQLWTSQEIGWQRLRGVEARSSQVTAQGKAAASIVAQTEELMRRPGGLQRVRELSQSADSPLLIQPLPAQINVGGREGQRGIEAQRWHEQAALIVSTLEQRAPGVFQTPEVQFARGALLRHRQMYQQSDEVYRRFAAVSDPVWQQAARGELWVLGSPAESPKPVILCKRVASPPVLDGLLSDICWQDADDAALTVAAPDGAQPAEAFVGSRQRRQMASSASAGAPGSGALAMLAYDAEYLYFAATLPRAPGLPAEGVQYAGRTHDAELGGYDRICLLLDVDRDYSTFYQFEVDSRGQTREACWCDQQWNPQWFVANDADSRRWTVEAAIPLKELVPGAPAGQTWAVGIVRTMPTIGVESWTHPAGAVPRPAAFGLVRFR